MSAPPDFANLYLEHLTPRLARLCVAHARCVAADVAKFTESHDSILRYARKYGAVYLPEDRLHDLDEWILSTFAHEIFEAEAQGFGGWLEMHSIRGGRVQ